jgi:tRNA-dihydrouridine synthase 1
MLTRHYGADLVYTPMLHSALFSKDPKYRSEHFTSCAGDRPLITQFCANDPLTLLEAARFVENDTDAVDINCGCPQGIARRGHYGAFLLDEPELIGSLLATCYDHLRVPVTCKIRILHSEAETMNLVRRIQNSGCWLLTVHGRHRESIKDRIGSVDFEMIRKIKQELKIPVFANGSVESMAEVEEILRRTGCDGVMTSEGILCNPALFRGIRKDPIDMARQYLHLARQYTTHSTAIRGHLFKILFREISYWTQYRDELAVCGDEALDQLLNRLEATREEERERRLANAEIELETAMEQIPTWYRRHLHAPALRDRSVLDIQKSEVAEASKRTAAAAAAAEESKQEAGVEEFCDFGCLLDG